MNSRLTVTELPPDGPVGYRFEVVLYAADVERLRLNETDHVILREFERGGRASDILRALTWIFRIAEQQQPRERANDIPV
jgi:hypothetical protein